MAPAPEPGGPSYPSTNSIAGTPNVFRQTLDNSKCQQHDITVVIQARIRIANGRPGKGPTV